MAAAGLLLHSPLVVRPRSPPPLKTLVGDIFSVCCAAPSAVPVCTPVCLVAARLPGRGPQGIVNDAGLPVQLREMKETLLSILGDLTA